MEQQKEETKAEIDGIVQKAIADCVMSPSLAREIKAEAVESLLSLIEERESKWIKVTSQTVLEPQKKVWIWCEGFSSFPVLGWQDEAYEWYVDSVGYTNIPPTHYHPYQECPEPPTKD
jgi:hypothetical protein